MTEERQIRLAGTGPPPVRRQDVSGRLDLVDLRRSRLRIRDLAGSDVQLDDVVDLDIAARLVGEQVTATGEAVLGSRGQVATVVRARIEQLVMPGRDNPTMREVRFDAPAPAAGDGIDDDEVAAFLELIGR